MLGLARSGGGAMRRGSALVTGAMVALVAAADWLFYGHLLGWTAGIFTAAVTMAILLRPAARAARRGRWVLAVAVAGLALSLVEEPTPLNITVTCVAIIGLAIVSREGWSGGIKTWGRRWASFVFLGWTQIFRDSKSAVKWARRRPEHIGPGPLAAVWGVGRWVIPVLLGGVFLWLFSLANPIIEHWVSRIGFHLNHWMQHVLPDLLDPLRIMFWLAVGIWVWALLRVRTRRARPSYQRSYMRPPLPPITPAADNAMDAGHVLMPVSRRGLVERCLIVFNVVFALETILDLFYLWGGKQLPHGMTIKEYAHRGSYPLIATALLAAAFVLLTFRRECEGKAWRTARLLVYAWIAQNVLLSFSAGWRLYLLVNASNLTRLRLATTVWLALVMIGLVSIVWRIVTRRDNRWLLRVNTRLLAAMLYVCCFLNLDGFIANYNADHCLDVARNGSALGLTYLRDLGIESIPALNRLSVSLDTAERRAMARTFADELRSEVVDDLRDWRGWTWRRHRLKPGPEFVHYRRRATQWLGLRRSI